MELQVQLSDEHFPHTLNNFHIDIFFEKADEQ